MGKFGVNPTKIAYIVSLPAYYKLLEDADFQTVDQIGNDRATILTGQVGQAYGSPVIVSDVLAPGDAGTACVAVNVDAFLVGRLRGVKIETDYEVANQRNAIVATQAIGFSRIQSALAATAVHVYCKRRLIVVYYLNFGVVRRPQVFINGLIIWQI